MGRMAVRRKAINRILAVVRGKQGHNRALRMRELQDYKSKAMQIPRYLLIWTVYIVIVFLTLFCLYINLIFGIKFTKEQQYDWVSTTYLAIFLDWVIYSTSKIVLQWLPSIRDGSSFRFVCCRSRLFWTFLWRNYG